MRSPKAGIRAQILFLSALAFSIALGGHTLSAQSESASLSGTIVDPQGGLIPDAQLEVNTSPAVGTVVDQHLVETVPLNGRSFQSLLLLIPGIVMAPADGFPANTAGQFSINGQRATANSFTLDGTSANFYAQPGFFGSSGTVGNLPALTTSGTTQGLVSVDALQELKAQTSTYAAEYGRQPGGQISIVTRSGTNQFHGSLFDYVRNDAFDANDWFANLAGQPKPLERQNDFGGVVGGPLLIPDLYSGRNRSFFFFSYEGLRLRLPQFTLTNVPGVALRQAAPPGTQVILDAFPLPNGRELGNGLAEYNASYSNPSDFDATSVRMDHVITDKVTAFGRYSRTPSDTVTRRTADLSDLQTSQMTTQILTFGFTAVSTERSTNELRVNFSDNAANTNITAGEFGGAAPLPRSAVIPEAYDSSTAQGGAALNFAGRTSAAIPAAQLTGNFVSSQRQFNIVDSLAYSAGSHQIKLGLDYRRLTPTLASNSYISNGTFTSQQQVLAAVAPTGSSSAGIAPLEPVINNFSAYAQDTWRLSDRLTVDFGFRWDVNPAPTEAHGMASPAVTEIDNLATMQLATPGTRLWKTTYANIAPRAGLAYRLAQAPRREMVVRTGFGVFYDTGNDQGASVFNASYPFFVNRLLTNVSYPLSPSLVAPPPIPQLTGLTPPYGLMTLFDPSLKLPYTMQWNVALERALGAHQTVWVSYVGASGRDLLQSTQLSLNRMNPRFTTVNLTRNGARSDYHAFQAQFQRRLSNGLQALISYTWSHAMDDDSNSNTLRVAQYGNADFDVRHVFAAAATYDLPGPRSTGAAAAILNGWSFNSTIHAQSALPVDIVARTDTNPVDGSLVNVRPNLNPGVPLYIDDPGLPCGRRINGAAFSTPAPGESGTLGRNQARGCNVWQVDAALRKQFPLTTKARLQFSAEAFNVFNHPNFGAIQTTLTSANFGRPTAMLNRQLGGGISELYQIGGPRSVQFALRMSF
ncbi:MAG TPA: hypothetical protein VNZ26_20545 [Vicinamibacterales bacterium]|nr:hypothetical protein [Vicinamibacterales bacterium]